jgi:outer membrane protein OmpA-like peptidoglycan-associated protein/tetratricopeptide (TPR) repeat protein
MKYLRKLISIPVILLLLIVLSPGYAAAQSISEKRADELYDDFAYSKAADAYKKLYSEDQSNPKYIQRLAYSYNKMLDFPQALKFYALLVQQDMRQPQDYYEYAQLLRVAGNIEDSKIWLEKYIVILPGDQRAIKQLESINQLLTLKANLQNVTFENLDGNTRFTDMCPAYFEDRIVYSSAKDSFSMVRNNFEWNDQPFLDLYITDPASIKTLQKDDKFSNGINSRVHEGPICFTSDFKTIYFTRNNFINGKISRTPGGVNNLKIFIADRHGNDWQNIREFQFNSDTYSVGHPTLSKDNKTLYFVSDMPGGYGETDIYKSEFLNGKWSKPLNIGESINTKGKEMFPYIDANGFLYYSSNGLPGIGGLDIFAAKQVESGNYLILNLGAPINSDHDDFGYVVNTDSLTGFLSSNRLGGKGEDDIYSFKVNKIDLRVICYDEKTKALIPGSRVSLLAENGKVLESKIADDKAFVQFVTNPGLKYQVLAENSSYLSSPKEIQIKGSVFGFSQDEDVFLKRGYPYLTIEVIDKESGLIIPNALVDISEGKYEESELEDNNGVIRMRMNESTDYTFYATSEEYFEKTVKFSSVGKPAGDYAITIEMEKISAGKQFVLDDLYYDLNKYNIRPDAEIVLNKLLKILQDNPEVRIEIASHTDSRGTAESNLKLSQNRSESVMSYLTSKGIAPSRLVAKGYGESQLINQCADGVICPEVDHQANRRTVIEILNPEIRRVKRGAKNVYYF